MKYNQLSIDDKINFKSLISYNKDNISPSFIASLLSLHLLFGYNWSEIWDIFYNKLTVYDKLSVL